MGVCVTLLRERRDWEEEEEINLNHQEKIKERKATFRHAPFLDGHAFEVVDIHKSQVSKSLESSNGILKSRYPIVSWDFYSLGLDLKITLDQSPSKKACLAAKLSFIFSFGFEQDRIIWCVNVNDADCFFVKGFKCRIKDLKQEIVPRCLSYYIHFEITGAAIWLALIAVWSVNRPHSFCS